MKMIESFEKRAIELPKTERFDKLAALNKNFDTKVTPIEGVFQKYNPALEENVACWLGIRGQNLGELSILDVFDATKRMYYGCETADGSKTRGLKEIGKMKINQNYVEQNRNQHAGFAAEVISTQKENMLAKIKGTGLTTFRADDLPDEFVRNDPYVDKVRKNAAGEVVERVQTKFVGKDGKDCLNKLMSKKYDKYFNDGKVDKIEIPKDYYEKIKEDGLIDERRMRIEKQLNRAKELGKTDVIEQCEEKIRRIDKIEHMVESSTVTKKEALNAKDHPKRYAAKNFMDRALWSSEVKAGLTAAALTASISTVDNVQKVMNGEITAEEAFVDVTKDTGTAGALGFGTEFISRRVADQMSKSSHSLIRSAGKVGITAAVISFGIDSFDSVVDFAQGEIDGVELAYDLGESGAHVAGGMAGNSLGSLAGAAAGAKVGAVIGTVIPGAGTVAGAAIGGVVGGIGVGIVGGMVGTAVASEAYSTAVELGGEGVEILADKAQDAASKTIELVKTEIPGKIDTIRSAINGFAKGNGIPIQV